MTVTETIARALRVFVGDQPDETRFLPAGMFAANHDDLLAGAAITAMTEAGYAIVPVEPTDEQRIAMHGVVIDPDWRSPYVSEIYRAMIEAGRASHNGA